MKLFCPSCGSALEFRYDDSFVRVCHACRSALVRTDRGIESLGQFADLAPATSGLALQDRGRWQGQGFVLVGRAEYRHPAGGAWEEWYLRFDDGRWGWLSHAEGRWALTFAKGPVTGVPELPALAPGEHLALAGLELTVGERSEAESISAEGELPFAFFPGARTRFVDLSDGYGGFATLDYGTPGAGEPPQLYAGRQVPFAELGLRLRAPSEAAVPVRSAERLSCPNCGGSIGLRLPGSSLSVVCPYCASVLDCEGPLAILARQRQLSERPPIPLGARGTFAGTTYTVTGRLRRSASYEGGSVEWDEYLLHAPGAGYRWLVCVNGHYSFVTELPPGAVREQPSGAVSYQGRDFKLFDRGEATVLEAFGEFHWRVSVGETVDTRDFIAPPLMLSEERSRDELHWSLGVYQSAEQVRSAFGLTELADPAYDVGPHQPFPHGHWRRVALALGVLLLLSAGLLGGLAEGREVFATRVDLGGPEMPAAADGSAGYATYVYFTPPFELVPRQNVEVRLALPLSNSWAYVLADLVDEATGELSSFDAELSQYSGYEQGEYWSEGSPRATHVAAARRGGSHVLRLEVQRPAPARDWLSISVRQDVFRTSYLVIALLALAGPAALLALNQFGFERRRWSQSDFAPASFGGDDD